MNKKIVMSLAIAVSLVLTAPVWAQNQPSCGGKAAELFKQADSNNDGKVTLEELRSVLAGMTQERFSALDRNGDAVLTREDLRFGGAGAGGARGAGQMLAKLKQADTNGDQRITFDEAKAAFPQATQERFSRFDRNGDGVISKEDRGAAGGRNGSGTVGAGQMLAKLKQADTNGDQQITFEEAKAAFPQATQERFGRFDRNGDGVISREDIGQAMAGKFKQADANGDGKVSLEEAKAAFPRATEEVFKRLDRNGDGFLSPEDRR